MLHAFLLFLDPTCTNLHFSRLNGVSINLLLDNPVRVLLNGPAIGRLEDLSTHFGVIGKFHDEEFLPDFYVLGVHNGDAPLVARNHCNS